MSSAFDQITRYTRDPHAARIKEMRQEIAKQRTKSLDLESEDLRAIGRMSHALVKLDDERLKFLTSLPSNTLHSTWELPIEPDGDKLKLWFMLDHLGTKITDLSGFGHHGFLKGHPTLQRASIDMGFRQSSASPATDTMQFNTALDEVGNPTGEYVIVPDHEDLQFAQYVNGFSIAFRFNSVDFSHDTSFGGIFNRRFASKVDDEDNFWSLVFDDTGDIDFQVSDNGVLYKRDFDLLSLNTWYDVAVTYNPLGGSTSADRIKIYVNGVEGSSTSSLGLIPAPSFENDLYIASRYEGNGFFRGTISSFMIWMDKVLTSTEVSNLNTNKWTTQNTPHGKVPLINYFTIDPE